MVTRSALFAGACLLIPSVAFAQGAIPKGRPAPAPAPAPASARPSSPVRGAVTARDPYVGTFAADDLSISLQRAPGGYSGEAQSAGGHYPVQARLVNGILQGSYIDNGVQRMFQAQVQGDVMQLAADGTTFMLMRQGAAVAAGPSPGQPMGAGAPPRAGAAPAPAGPQAGGAIASSPQDRQIAQLLLRSAWCSFAHSQVSGTTSTSRVAFTPDGRWRMGSQRESQSSNQYGQVYGSSSGGDQGMWRVQNGALLMSSDGAQWETLPLQITQNSSGYPIVNAGGREYSMCN